MSDGWNPVREEFFKRTLSRDFKTIYQRQLDIAERGIYREGRQLKVRFRPDKIVPGRTGHLRDRLAAAEFQITGVDPIMLETGYPLYIRFLDMRKKRDLRIYNRQIWGIVYNNALPDLIRSARRSATGWRSCFPGRTGMTVRIVPDTVLIDILPRCPWICGASHVSPVLCPFLAGY